MDGLGLAIGKLLLDKNRTINDNGFSRLYGLTNDIFNYLSANSNKGVGKEGQPSFSWSPDEFNADGRWLGN